MSSNNIKTDKQKPTPTKDRPYCVSDFPLLLRYWLDYTAPPGG
jgi:hypothetical protein